PVGTFCSGRSAEVSDWVPMGDCGSSSVGHSGWGSYWGHYAETEWLPPYPAVVVTRCRVFDTGSLTHEVGGQSLGDRVCGLLTPLGVLQQCRVLGVAHVRRLEEDLGNRGQGESAQVGAFVQTVVGQVVRDRDVGHLQILAVDVLGQDLGGF